MYCHVHTTYRSAAEWAPAEGTHFALEPVPSCKNPIYALVTTHAMSSSATEAFHPRNRQRGWNRTSKLRVKLLSNAEGNAHVKEQDKGDGREADEGTEQEWEEGVGRGVL